MNLINYRKNFSIPTIFIMSFLTNFSALFFTSILTNQTLNNNLLAACIIVSLTISLIVTLSINIGETIHFATIIFNFFSIINMIIIATSNNHGSLSGINGFINYLSIFILGLLIGSTIEFIQTFTYPKNQLNYEKSKSNILTFPGN